MWYTSYTFMSLCFVIVAHGFEKQLFRPPPDAGLTTEQQVRKYGYPFENHLVTTDDGYILAAHRIPHGVAQDTPNNRVVLLMPGVWRSSEAWVSFGPERSLGFILADSGFDVWIGNFRGTTWSKKHVLIDPEQNPKEFWNFSLDEMGHYDCPAFVDYILKITGQKNIMYIGDTIGATGFFIMVIKKPEYNEKVKLMIASAPLVKATHAKSPYYAIFSRFKHEMQKIADKFGNYEILKHDKWLSWFGMQLCSIPILNTICAVVHSIGVGFDFPQLNMTAIPLLLNGFPAGSSLKEILHITQLYETGIFAKYDYGKNGNLEIYKQPTPPQYDLSKITTPVVIYYSDHDAFVGKQDVEEFAPRLKSIISMNFIKGYNNGDFLWATNVVELIYRNLITFMKSFDPV